MAKSFLENEPANCEVTQYRHDQTKLLADTLPPARGSSHLPEAPPTGPVAHWSSNSRIKTTPHIENRLSEKGFQHSRHVNRVSLAGLISKLLRGRGGYWSTGVLLQPLLTHRQHCRGRGHLYVTVQEASQSGGSRGGGVGQGIRQTTPKPTGTQPPPPLLTAAYGPSPFHPSPNPCETPTPNLCSQGIWLLHCSR